MRDRGLSEAVLELVRSRPSATRAALIEQTGVGRTVLTQRLTDLIDVGLVAEAGLGASTGGRAPREVRFRSEAAVVVGIEVGATSIDVALTDLGGTPLASSAQDWAVTNGPAATVDRLVEAVDAAVAAAAVPRSLLVGVGVGLPGPVEFARGRPVSPPIMPGWDDYPIRDSLADRVGAEVVVDNDVNMMAVGEQRAGLARGVENFAVIKIGTGIGAGLVSGGRLHRGAEGCAGDIGHMSVDANSSALCRCGKYGCLEALAGGGALAVLAQDAAAGGTSSALAALAAGLDRPLTAADLTRAAQAGDPVAIALFSRAARLIGGSLASLVNLLNPSLVVVGGGVARAGDLILPGLRQAVLERSLSLATRNLRIELTRLGERAGTIGAAFTVIDRLLRADRLDWWARRATG